MKVDVEKVEMMTVASICTVLEPLIEDLPYTTQQQRALNACKGIREVCIEARQKKDQWTVFGDIADKIEFLLGEADLLRDSLVLLNTHYWYCSRHYQIMMIAHTANILAIGKIQLKRTNQSAQHRTIIDLVKKSESVYR